MKMNMLAAILMASFATAMATSAVSNTRDKYSEALSALSSLTDAERERIDALVADPAGVPDPEIVRIIESVSTQLKTLRDAAAEPVNPFVDPSRFGVTTALSTHYNSMLLATRLMQASSLVHMSRGEGGAVANDISAIYGLVNHLGQQTEEGALQYQRHIVENARKVTGRAIEEGVVGGTEARHLIDTLKGFSEDDPFGLAGMIVGGQARVNEYVAEMHESEQFQRLDRYLDIFTPDGDIDSAGISGAEIDASLHECEQFAAGIADIMTNLDGDDAIEAAQKMTDDFEKTDAAIFSPMRSRIVNYVRVSHLHRDQFAAEMNKLRIVVRDGNGDALRNAAEIYLEEARYISDLLRIAELRFDARGDLVSVSENAITAEQRAMAVSWRADACGRLAQTVELSVCDFAAAENINPILHALELIPAYFADLLNLERILLWRGAAEIEQPDIECMTIATVLAARLAEDLPILSCVLADQIVRDVTRSAPGVLSDAEGNSIEQFTAACDRLDRTDPFGYEDHLDKLIKKKLAQLARQRLSERTPAWEKSRRSVPRWDIGHALVFIALWRNRVHSEPTEVEDIVFLEGDGAETQDITALITALRTAVHAADPEHGAITAANEIADATEPPPILEWIDARAAEQMITRSALDDVVTNLRRNK